MHCVGANLCASPWSLIQSFKELICILSCYYGSVIYKMGFRCFERGNCLLAGGGGRIFPRFASALAGCVCAESRFSAPPLEASELSSSCARALPGLFSTNGSSSLLPPLLLSGSSAWAAPDSRGQPAGADAGGISHNALERCPRCWSSRRCRWHRTCSARPRSLCTARSSRSSSGDKPSTPSGMARCL